MSPLKQSKGCREQSCPIDCKVSQWSAWSKCDEPCGFSGTKKRTRNVWCINIMVVCHAKAVGSTVQSLAVRINRVGSHLWWVEPRFRHAAALESMEDMARLVYMSIDTSNCNFDTQIT